MNRQYLYIIGVGVAALVVSLIAVVMAGTAPTDNADTDSDPCSSVFDDPVPTAAARDTNGTLLSDCSLADFSGFVPIARLVPLILLVGGVVGGGALVMYGTFRGRGSGKGRKGRRRSVGRRPRFRRPRIRALVMMNRRLGRRF